MALAHGAALQAAAQLGLQRPQPRLAPGAQRRQAGVPGARGVQLLQHPPHGLLHLHRLPEGTVRRSGGRGGMEIRQPQRQALDGARRQSSPLQPLAHQRRVGEAAHHHRVVDHRPIAAPERRRGRAAHRHHPQVQRGRQAPVQPQLLQAGLPAPGGTAEVQERQAHRLLELEGQALREQHPGDVRLQHHHRQPGAVLQLRAQRLDVELEIGGGIHGASMRVHGALTHRGQAVRPVMRQVKPRPAEAALGALQPCRRGTRIALDQATGVEAFTAPGGRKLLSKCPGAAPCEARALHAAG